jgi:pimeloyl-ACP methyl ester carboxylesterase
MSEIAVRSVGDGPGIVLVHGGGVLVDEYRRLATALAGRFTVHLYHRRGRGDAAAMDETYTVEDEVDDLARVLRQTGARRVLGHSYGGFVALRAALRLPLDRVAVFDAPIPVAGLLPTGFLDDLEAAVQAGDRTRAFLAMSRGMHTRGLPAPVQKAVARVFLRTRIGRTMGDLLPTVVREARQIEAHEGPATNWAGITAPVLLGVGARSAPHFRAVAEALAAVLPDARVDVRPRAAHNAIAIARPAFVAPFAAFLAA